MTMTWKRRLHSQRGAALLETAVTLPVLLLVSTGIIEFGRAYQTWQVLTNAAREGARIAVLPGTTDDAVKTRIKNYLEAGKISAPASAKVNIVRTTPITIPGAANTTGSTVNVDYDFEFMVLQPVAQLIVHGTDVGSPLTMHATAMMRNE